MLEELCDDTNAYVKFMFFSPFHHVRSLLRCKIGLSLVDSTISAQFQKEKLMFQKSSHQVRNNKLTFLDINT